MKNFKILGLVCICLISCKDNDEFQHLGAETGIVEAANCADADFPEWSLSNYVLPYPVGDSYQIGLSACTSSYHAPGQPDQFAIDFNMPINSLITASVGGQVVHVEESGNDYEFPNNLVVVKSGTMYVQYMHLTKNGAAVEVGDIVNKGQIIGYSGATGLAGYPHLHFVVTSSNGWQYPYDSVPVTFKNTTANPESLVSGAVYTAEAY